MSGRELSLSQRKEIRVDLRRQAEGHGEPSLYSRRSLRPRRKRVVEGALPLWSAKVYKFGGVGGILLEEGRQTQWSMPYHRRWHDKMRLRLPH